MQVRVSRKTGQAMALLVAAALVVAAFVVLFGAKPAQASFPGPNGKIAFVKSNGVDPDNGSIFTVNANGSGLTKIAASASATGPAFSPTGTKVAYSQAVNGAQELYTMNVDGSGKTRLTNNADHDDFPSFSPDGRRIVFKSNRAGNGVNDSPDPDNEIWVMKAAPEGATNVPVRLTDNAASDGATPTGRRTRPRSRSPAGKPTPTT